MDTRKTGSGRAKTSNFNRRLSTVAASHTGNLPRDNAFTQRLGTRHDAADHQQVLIESIHVLAGAPGAPISKTQLPVSAAVDSPLN